MVLYFTLLLVRLNLRTGGGDVLQNLVVVRAADTCNLLHTLLQLASYFYHTSCLFHFELRVAVQKLSAINVTSMTEIVNFA